MNDKQLRFWVSLVLGVLCFTAGTLFLSKVFEFALSLTDMKLFGFAVMPLINYTMVALGFLALLVWAFLSGQFSDVERTKVEFLDDQERFDREDPHIHPELLEESQGGVQA